MQYVELNNKYEIKEVIEDVKAKLKDLSKILVPSERQTTGKGNTVITLFYNLEPAMMKVEGEEDVINQFLKILEEEKKGY